MIHKPKKNVPLRSNSSSKIYKTRKMRYLGKTVNIIFFCLGIIFFAMVVLAFTPAPFFMYYRLGNCPSDNAPVTRPEQVVMFGGAGMPSEDNLMRLYYTAASARHFKVPVLLVHPKDSLCQAEMTRLLRQGGIDNISYMTAGTNTRSQALELFDKHPELRNAQLLIITSPEHVKRTVKSLKKVGFSNITGIAAYPSTVDFDLSIKQQRLGGNEVVPSVESVNLRYTFFNYLKLEITCAREHLALAYYKLKGWI